MTAPPRISRAPISPHPLGATLPALYLDDVFAQNLCASLDEVLAPAISVLDCFPAYLDPWTAPPDMVDWLASWTGLLAARKLPVARRRRLVARAAALHAWRGTPDAVRELVELACNRPVELEESGEAAGPPTRARRSRGRSSPAWSSGSVPTSSWTGPTTWGTKTPPLRSTRTCSLASWSSSSPPTSPSASTS